MLLKLYQSILPATRSLKLIYLSSFKRCYIHFATFTSSSCHTVMLLTFQFTMPYGCPAMLLTLPCSSCCAAILVTFLSHDHDTSRENQKICFRGGGGAEGGGFRPGRTQTCLCSHRSQLEAWNLDTGTSCIILCRHWTTKALIRLRMHRRICAFVVRIWQKQVISWHGSCVFWLTARKKYPHPMHFFSSLQ